MTLSIDNQTVTTLSHHTPTTRLRIQRLLGNNTFPRRNTTVHPAATMIIRARLAPVRTPCQVYRSRRTKTLQRPI